MVAHSSQASRPSIRRSRPDRSSRGEPADGAERRGRAQPRDATEPPRRDGAANRPGDDPERTAGGGSGPASREASGEDGSGIAVFRIAEAARHAGVSPSALRLWEQQGLVSPSRSRGRYRLYSAEDLSRLRRIARLRHVEGLNAAAIRRLEDSARPSLPGTAAAGEGRAAPQPASIGLEVAGRLHRLRTREGLSLRAAAGRTGLSASFISSLERGTTGASLTALRKLTAAYGTTLGELLREPSLEGSRLVRAPERRVLEAGDGIRIEDLATAPSELESQLFVLSPGASSDGYYAHRGEELMFVLEGSVGVWLGEGEYYELSQGDALTFPSTLAHRFAALGTTETRLVWINTPPTF